MLKKLFFIEIENKSMIVKNLYQCLIVIIVINYINIWNTYMVYKNGIKTYDGFKIHKFIDILEANTKWHNWNVFGKVSLILSVIVVLYFFIRGIYIIVFQWKDKSIDKLLSISNHLFYSFMITLVTFIFILLSMHVTYVVK